MSEPLAAATARSGTDRRRDIYVLGVRIDRFDSGQEVLKYLAVRPSPGPRHLCYVNAHSLNLAYTDARYQRALDRAALVLNDGVGLRLAAKMQGECFPENLNGSDFTPRLLKLAAVERWRIFLYGGKPGVAEAAGEKLTAEIPGLSVVGICDGYTHESPEVVRQVLVSGADVIVVALGQPTQELWLDEHLESTGCQLGLGVGALLDFVSGHVVRAPGWMNRLGVEWIFRLLQEPGRLWRRYLVGNPLFVLRALRCRGTRLRHLEEPTASQSPAATAPADASEPRWPGGYDRRLPHLRDLL